MSPPSARHGIAALYSPKRQYEIVSSLERVFTHLENHNVPTTARFLDVVKKIARHHVRGLPCEIMVRPAVMYAAHIPSFRVRSKRNDVGVVVPVEDNTTMKNGALVAEYTQIVVIWFSECTVSPRCVRIPVHRCVSRLEARDRAAQLLVKMSSA